MTHKEMQALVSLLDDDDKEIIGHVEDKIMELGDVTIPFLEHEWETNFNPHVQRRIEELIHNLQFEAIQKGLSYWKEEEQEDLLQGMWLVARYQYPDLSFKKLEEEIEKIYYEVWLNHRPHASPSDKLKALNQVLFHKLNFSPNTQNFHAPSNSMLNIVLEKRKGNPIALCVIYMLIAQRLKMPVYGVNLPNTFVLTYKSDETQFYINAFTKGLFFSKKDIDDYLNKLRLKPAAIFYEPCSHLAIVQRVLRNLALAYEKLGEAEKMEEVQILLDCLD